MCCFEATRIATFVDVRMGKSLNYWDIGDWVGSARTRPFHHQERKKEQMVNGFFAGDCFICCLGLNPCCSCGRCQWCCWYLSGAIANHPCINHGYTESYTPSKQINISIGILYTNCHSTLDTMVHGKPTQETLPIHSVWPIKLRRVHHCHSQWHVVVCTRCWWFPQPNQWMVQDGQPQCHGQF